MFATVRRYAGLDSATITAIAERATDISRVLASVPGARGAQLILIRDGLIVVTIAIDEPALVESGRRFRAWADDQIRGFRSVDEPDVWAGPAVIGDEARWGEAVGDRVGAAPRRRTT